MNNLINFNMHFYRGLIIYITQLIYFIINEFLTTQKRFNKFKYLKYLCSMVVRYQNSTKSELLATVGLRFQIQVKFIYLPSIILTPASLYYLVSVLYKASYQRTNSINRSFIVNLLFLDQIKNIQVMFMSCLYTQKTHDIRCAMKRQDLT